MEIDLGELRARHPRLPEDLALLMTVRAALGLQRNGHESPAGVELDIERTTIHGVLCWPAANLSDLEQHDGNRVTEDGAEAICLILAHRARGWRIVRRMQREESADWLLEHGNGTGREMVALEVSGVDRGNITSRLREKLAQVADSPDVDQRWAGVVGFEEPLVALHSAQEALS